jgi:hypothetical protein
LPFFFLEDLHFESDVAFHSLFEFLLVLEMQDTT